MAQLIQLPLVSVLLLPLVLLGISPAQAQVSWHPPTQEVIEGQPFELQLEVVQLRSVPGSPDLTALRQQFDLLSSRSSYLTERHNGRTHYISRWKLQLQPRQAGDLQIPPISVKGEQTQPLLLQVTPKPQRLSERIRLISELEQSEVYPGQPLKLRLQLYYNLPLQHAEMTQPSLDGIKIAPLGGQRAYSEQLDNRRYQVIEQHYLLQGDQPGDYLLEELTLKANRTDGQVLEVRSQPVAFRIHPWPEDLAQTPTLVASEVQLQQHWPQQQAYLRAGDTLVRTLELVGHGIPAAWLPNPQLAEIDGITLYPQPPQLEQRLINGVLVSRKIIDYKLLLTRAGQFQLPSAQLPWWDSVREAMELAEVPGRTIEVQPFMAAPPSQQSNQTATPSSDVIPDSPAPSATDEQAQPSLWQAWAWAAIALICALGWTLSWQKRKQLEIKMASLEQASTAPATPPEQHRSSVATAAQTEPRSPLRAEDPFEQLAQACRANDPELTHQQLFDWAEKQWPAQPIRTLLELEQQAKDPTLGYLLRNLEYHAANPHEYWDGELLLQRLERLRRRLSSSRPSYPTAEPSAPEPKASQPTDTQPRRPGSIHFTIDD
ncbi:BatD family protein [Motiliproteus coralliicola]|uniref:BatD family protein n=1 Tax=Motiliproteus coralliicola TaxID=2283196 RepID=UPI001403C916|nr:BatD family protein [Motiliproteus coralliicola]